MMDRMDDMLDRYGECCTRTVAAKILGRSRATVRAMIEDGRLDLACAGTMVDVRSIARYIDQPAQHNLEARQKKAMLKRKSNWSV